MYSDPAAEGYVVHDGDTGNKPCTPKDPEICATDPKLMFSSIFEGNVTNYDFLPTFVDLAGGDSTTLKDIDGIRLTG